LRHFVVIAAGHHGEQILAEGFELRIEQFVGLVVRQLVAADADQQPDAEGGQQQDAEQAFV